MSGKSKIGYFDSTVKIVDAIPNGETVLTLSNVLWVPSLEFCLLSVSSLTRLGGKLCYNGLRARIYGLPASGQGDDLVKTPELGQAFESTHQKKLNKWKCTY